MSRRHYGGQTSQYNIITGDDISQDDKPQRRTLNQHQSSSIFPTQDESDRFQTTNSQIGRGLHVSNDKLANPADNPTPYYGRKRMTNQFYSENGVVFDDNVRQAPSHQSNTQAPQSEEHKYSRYY